LLANATPVTLVYKLVGKGLQAPRERWVRSSVLDMIPNSRQYRCLSRCTARTLTSRNTNVSHIANLTLRLAGSHRQLHRNIKFAGKCSPITVVLKLVGKKHATREHW